MSKIQIAFNASLAVAQALPFAMRAEHELASLRGDHIELHARAASILCELRELNNALEANLDTHA